MKNILFVSPHLILGGVEKSLINMLKNIDNEKYNVDTYFVKAQGPMLKNIPEKVCVNELSLKKIQSKMLLMGGRKKTLIYCVKKLKLISAISILIKIALRKPHPEFCGSFKNLEPLTKKYDIAICYHIHMPFIVRYVAEKVNAEKKYIWIHNDFFTTKYDVKSLKKYLDKFDIFFAVSLQLFNEFIFIFPEYKARTEVFYNIIDFEDIKKKAEIEADWGDNYEGKRFLTVGRLDNQKGYDLAIEAANLLNKDGYDFKWYFIGSGSLKDYLIKQIEKFHLNEKIALLGSKDNPYPYYNKCDIYIQTSRHEGYCITIAEARIFSNPIITTNFPAIYEQIEHLKNGYITEINSKSIYFALKNILDNKDLYYTLSHSNNSLNIKTNIKHLEDIL